MRFYTRQHLHYCGIDLHARTIYIVITDQVGQVLVERNVKANAGAFLSLVKPYRNASGRGPSVVGGRLAQSSW